MRKREHVDRSTERRTARLIAFGVLLFVGMSHLSSVLAVLRWLMNILMPVLLGLVFALILNVPMRGFERIFARLDRKKRVKKNVYSTISLALSVILVPLLLLVLIRFVVPQLITAVTDMVNIVRANESQINAFVAGLGFDADFISGKVNEVLNWITGNIGNIAGTAISMVSSLASILMAIILAIYLLADKEAVKRRSAKCLCAFLPEKTSDYILRVGRMFSSTFSVFLAKQCLEAGILASLLMVGMLICRLPYVVTIGCMTAMLALIPYLGYYASFAIGCILIVTLSPMKALVYAIVFIVAQQIEGNFIYPRVVGKSVGLPAYITLSAVVIGGAVAGIAGMFFIIPMASVAYVLAREEVHERLESADKKANERETGAEDGRDGDD